MIKNNGDKNEIKYAKNALGIAEKSHKVWNSSVLPIKKQWVFSDTHFYLCHPRVIGP